jgi:hypothetical protein
LLLISLRGDQAIDLHFEFLPNTVSSRDSLQIILRVPIRIEDDNDSC